MKNANDERASVKAIILAGGKGTRLQNVISNLPKPLAPVRGQPFIFILIRFLLAHQIDEIIISTCHLAEKFEELLPDLKKFSSKISLLKEPHNLGTGGAVRFVCEKMGIREQVLVLNGDTFFNFDLSEFMKTYQNTPALALSEVQNSSRYGTVALHNGMIAKFNEKTATNAPGLIYAGFSLLNGQDIRNSLEAGKSSLEQDFFPIFLRKGTLAGKVYRAHFIDIGIAEDYQRANSTFDFSLFL